MPLRMIRTQRSKTNATRRVLRSCRIAKCIRADDAAYSYEALLCRKISLSGLYYILYSLCLRLQIVVLHHQDVFGENAYVLYSDSNSMHASNI